ncbi:MAG: Ppx/GppA family phosphatase [Clostridiales bacterium]|nr:Ppx/GppA family phosphatase [Clostridiales bacterium]
MKRIGIIDIGSNSIKFFVGEKREDGTIATIIDENDIARLGEGLKDTGRISDEALERNAQSVAAFAAKAKENGAEQIISIGTMALRTASNSADFVKRVKELCDVDVQIIPGEEEARLSYLAILSGMPVPDGDLIIFDTGGGSTEFIFGKGTELVKRFSVNLGAIRITEKFFADDPVAEGSVEAAIRQIDEEFAAAGVEGKPVKLVGMGGTVTSMGAVKHKMVVYDPDVIQGSSLTRADIAEQIKEYSARTIEQRRELPGLQPKRAEVILAGACILQDIIDRLGVDELTISDRGVRHGLAFDVFSK